MGADDRTVLKTVVLPLILPYLVSGYAFAFVLSLNEYIVAYMTVGFTIETLPIKIFNALRYGYTPTMASVSVFFVAIAALVFGLIARFGDIRRLLGAMAWSGELSDLVPRPTSGRGWFGRSPKRRGVGFFTEPAARSPALPSEYPATPSGGPWKVKLSGLVDARPVLALLPIPPVASPRSPHSSPRQSSQSVPVPAVAVIEAIIAVSIIGIFRGGLRTVLPGAVMVFPGICRCYCGVGASASSSRRHDAGSHGG